MCKIINKGIDEKYVPTIKHSKCDFEFLEVKYLGHIIVQDGVKVDPKKIVTMQEWPLPKTLKSLRGFLGPMVYYRKFVNKYGKIAAPLTTILKKNAFSWNEEINKHSYF